MSDEPSKPGYKVVFNPLESIKESLRSAYEVPKLPDSVTNPARWMHKRLAEYIRDFESDLDEDHEIGARLVSFGQTVVFHIEDMGYYGPDIICFYGINEQSEAVQLIQHISQLSVLLVAVKKLEEKPRRIGFDLSKKAEEETDDQSDRTNESSNQSVHRIANKSGSR